MLCDSLDGLAELQAQLLPWCEQQGITTELQWWSQVMAAALSDLHGIQWLIHGDTVRAEALLQATSTTMASEPSTAWLRERFAEALIDQRFASASAAPCQQLIAADPAPSVDQPLLRRQALADAVECPAQPIQAWLARLAEPLACHDNAAVREALRGLWT